MTPTEDRRTEKLDTRLTPVELAYVDHKAGLIGVKRAAYIRTKLKGKDFAAFERRWRTTHAKEAPIRNSH